MKTENIILDKTYAFALKIISVYKHLSVEKREFVLSKQLLRSGTSIGANMEEAQGGQSQRDFLAKISISYKEARESSYWIRLLRDSDYLTAEEANSLLNDCDEVIKIIGSIQKSIKNKL
jgi:four helix bundle protein